MPAAALGMIVLALVTVPSSNRPVVVTETVTFQEGVDIVHTRCTPCHSDTPTQAGFRVPPKDIVFDTSDQMVKQAALIRAMAVDTEIMPLANVTSMTDEERTVLEVWLDEYTNG